MGLEPGNCHPDGRDKMRESGTLVELQPGEQVSYCVHLQFFRDKTEWQSSFIPSNQE